MVCGKFYNIVIEIFNSHYVQNESQCLYRLSIVAADIITVLLARIRQNVYYTVDGVWPINVCCKQIQVKGIMTNRYNDEVMSQCDSKIPDLTNSNVKS